MPARLFRVILSSSPQNVLELGNGLGFVFNWPQEHLGEEQWPGAEGAVPRSSIFSQMFMTEKGEY